MPPKRRGRGSSGGTSRGDGVPVRGGEEEDESGTGHQSGAWLTFMNSECYSEQDVRALFEKYGGLTDCDGALGGPEDGWVMVSMASEKAASRAVQALKESSHPVGNTISLINSEGDGEKIKGIDETICLRCGKSSHKESECRSRERMCNKCTQNGEQDLGTGHFDSIHEVSDPDIRRRVLQLLSAPRPFADWLEEAVPANGPTPPSDKAVSRVSMAETVKIRTKRQSPVDKRFSFDSPDRFGGSQSLLSASELGELGGIRHFTETNSKILELVSHNNLLLTERLKDTVDDCNRQLKEKDDQIRRLQNLLNEHKEDLRKLTSRLSATQDFENKVKKFFGENEEFHKKRVGELSKANAELVKKLEESEKARMEKVLEESDTSKVIGQVEKLSHVTDSIQSKAEQILALVNGLELGEAVRTDSGKGEGRAEVVSGSTTLLLHNKVDKAIRLLAETSENQKKMNKVLQDLMKIGQMKQELELDGEEKKSKKRKKDDKERDRSRGRERKRSRSRSPDRERRRARSRSDSGERSSVQQVQPPAVAFDHEFEEMKWALNMGLIGDGHWNSLNQVPDISVIAQKMEKKVNFKILGREGETLTRMWDEVEKCLLVSLPKTCYKVAISIGTADLEDPGLICLKDAPLQEVRRRNEPKLRNKARILKDIVLSLIASNKQVIVMIPPHGAERMEVLQHWEEILLATLREIVFPKIRILNMAQVMRKTMGEFRSHEEYLDQWLAPIPPPLPRRHLSAYGTRRMFYALRQISTAKSPQAAEMGNWPMADSSQHASLHTLPGHGHPAAVMAAIAPPRPEDFPCPRCTRQGHAESECKSMNRVCRKCNNVGHFVEVHDVDDERFRQLIVRTLGVNLWADTKSSDPNDHERDYESEPKRIRRDQPAFHGPRAASPPTQPTYGDTRRIPLEKLAELERRVGVGESGGGNGYQAGWHRKDSGWYE